MNNVRNFIRKNEHAQMIGMVEIAFGFVQEANLEKDSECNHHKLHNVVY